MSAVIAIVAGVIAIVAFVLVILTGYRAITTVPTRDNPNPHLEGRRIARAFILSLICGVAFVVFLIAGVVWIVEQFTT